MFARILFLISVIGSLISQHPLLLDTSISSFLKATWVLPFAYLFFNNPRGFAGRSVKVPFLYSLSFLLYCLALEGFSITATYISADFNNVAISFFIFLISYVYWARYGSLSVMNWICVSLVIVGLVLSLFVYENFFSDYDVTSRSYAYNAKNSLGQILLSIVLVSSINFRPKRFFLRYVSYILLLPLLYVMFVLKSRATIAGFFFVVVYAIYKVKSVKIKCLAVLAVAIAVGYIIIDPTAYSVVVDGILFGGRDANDMDSLSSGRTEIIADAVKTIPDNLWLGIGNKYVDCMPIVMVIQYGILGASIIFFYLIALGLRVSKKIMQRRLHLTAYLLFFVFIINSLFEAQPPFGPGVKCFLLWMLIGFSFAQKDLEHVETIKKKSVNV